MKTVARLWNITRHGNGSQAVEYNKAWNPQQYVVRSVCLLIKTTVQGDRIAPVLFPACCTRQSKGVVLRSGKVQEE